MNEYKIIFLAAVIKFAIPHLLVRLFLKYMLSHAPHFAIGVLVICKIEIVIVSLKLKKNFCELIDLS